MVEVSFWGGGGELGLNGLVHVKGLVVTHTAHTASPPRQSLIWGTFGVLSITVRISEQTVAFLCPI